MASIREAGIGIFDFLFLTFDLAVNRKSKIKNLLLIVLVFVPRTDLSKARKILGLDLGRRFVFATDCVIHFFAMNGDFLGGVDSEPHLVATNVDNGHLDIIPNHDRLIALTGQH